MGFKVGKLFDTFGIGDKLFGNKEGKNTFLEGLGISKDYADKFKGMGDSNYSLLEGLAKKSQEQADAYDLNVDNAISESNRNFDASKNQANSDLASMGYTPQSNSVYADSNSSFAREKALGEESIRNSANTAKLNAQQNALGLSGNLYNQGFQNQMGAYGNAMSGQLGANNALGAYYQNKYDNNMGLLGAGLGAVGSIFGGGK